MIRAIVTDIEGTTSSLSFVKDVLFPYAHTHLAEFVQAHGRGPVVRALLDEAHRLAGADLDDVGLVAQLIRWIDEDKKITPLKALQGMIWEAGYRQGDFTGHVYADAVRKLRAWQAAGIRLYVFSSGSVQAQKLLFAHSDHGDLTPLFAGYFDTNIGAKKEAASYRRIAAAIGVPAAEILFLSDTKDELDAARAAGMRTAWLVRDGAADPGAEHPQAGSFDDIVLE